MSAVANVDVSSDAAAREREGLAAALASAGAGEAESRESRGWRSARTLPSLADGGAAPPPAPWVRALSERDDVDVMPNPPGTAGSLMWDTLVGAGRFERIDVLRIRPAERTSASMEEDKAPEGEAGDGVGAASLPSVVFAWRCGARMRGWPGILHGGATAAMFDEAMGCLVHHAFAGGAFFTVNLSVDYRSPGKLAGRGGTSPTLRVEARVVGSERRKVMVAAVMTDGEAAADGGTVIAEANAVFLRMRPEVAAAVGKIAAAATD
uniref:Thioesterase domain-containing protein n=2 Tax=Bicosoecida sp. CB-2014 TaxID=1486930 RepID=A0A7S1C9B2_9STRA